jgi:hypothetical protein
MLNQQLVKRVVSVLLTASAAIVIPIEAKATIIDIDFRGTVYEGIGDQDSDIDDELIGEQGTGDLVIGSVEFDDTSVFDSNPDPGIGIYNFTTGASSLSVGEDLINLDNTSARIVIKDNSGCDCFFLEIPINQVIGGTYTSNFMVVIENEFGPDAFTMFSDDSLPTSTFAFPDAGPDSTYTDLQFRDDSFAVIGRATLDEFSISSAPGPSISPVPEPNPLWLLGAGLFGFVLVRNNNLKSTVIRT